MSRSPNPDRRMPQISSVQPESAASTAETSPVETANYSPRSQFVPSAAPKPGPPMLGAPRAGAGSPSHDANGLRPFSKRYARPDTQRHSLTSRAREIQASEGVVWGPPASGSSTPLREVIPESPSQDGFPGFGVPTEDTVPARRPRAGTVPSRFSPATPPGLTAVASKPARPPPSTSPFKAAATVAADSSTLLSRLRAGSLPQQTAVDAIPQWDGARLRSSTLASVRQASGSKDLLADLDVRTLDYLGLAEAPRHSAGPFAVSSDVLPELAALRNMNRIRSYSVNAQEQYLADEETKSGVMTPMDAALAQTRAQIHHHNLAVQAFASQASANRPRAQTAGVLDSPLRPAPRYIPPPTRPRQMSKAVPLDWSEELETRPDLLQASLQSHSEMDELSLEKPTRALWLGNIPSSTTTASLDAIFGLHGTIESSRVLVHKSCGFVNFERVESARSAKAALNGKEIFPGAGPVRVGYAKVPAPSPSSESTARGFDPVETEATMSPDPVFDVGSIEETRSEFLQILQTFDVSVEDAEGNLKSATKFTAFKDEIRSISDPSQTRMFDASRLREIRKQIDNDMLSIEEIEHIADEMLPEICELASDYLGNTVVQKLFECCTEEIRQRMLDRLAPVLAQIGVHKNGTWAAQKIIEVTRTPSQMRLIADSIRPYTVALFLDQYGNYVLQGILRFGYPYNNFIFETIMTRIWDIGQGRFGARAMRACLESVEATRTQQCMAAASIVRHGASLCANPNGMLLLTWLLDTCTLPRRREVLAIRLQPYLAALTTHKIANMTVLKLLNQQNEIEARDLVANAVFFTPVLDHTLTDPVCGPTFIFKALMAPCLDEERRRQASQQIRDILLRLKAVPNPSNRRLMDEVGLTTRTAKEVPRPYQENLGNRLSYPAPPMYPHEPLRAMYANPSDYPQPLLNRSVSPASCYPTPNPAVYPSLQTRPMQLPLRPFMPPSGYVQPGAYMGYGGIPQYPAQYMPSPQSSPLMHGESRGRRVRESVIACMADQ